MSRASQVCPEHGCPNLQLCSLHRASPRSSRNHRGIPRQRRGHGAAYDRARRELAGQPCALRLPGCTGAATSADYTRPGDWTSPLQPACLRCQRVQGAAISRAGR